MDKIKKIKDKLSKALKGKGMYISLAICLVCVGAAGLIAYKAATGKLNSSLNSLKDNSANMVDNPLGDVRKDDGLSSGLQSVVDTMVRVVPVDGDLLSEFSNGALVHSKTLGVWQTHDGVDIAAAENTNVKAMSKGTVKEIKEDPIWGYSIEIDHANGITSYYYNLGQAMTVSEGDTVDAGDIIGVVGKSAAGEIAEESHLHFAVKRNNEWIDPMEFVLPGKSK